jgi:hypothetical protein
VTTSGTQNEELVANEAGGLLDVLKHPNQRHYPVHRAVRTMTMKSKQNPSLEFDPEEKQLLHDFETKALRSIATRELLDDLKQSAQATGHKDQRINI